MLAKKLVVVLLALAVSGCAALGALMQAAQMFDSQLDYAQQKQQMYYDRHPALDPAQLDELNAAMAAARETQLLLDIALSLKDGSHEEKAAAAAKAYERLYKLLERSGVKDATAPPGGAESDAPLPTPASALLSPADMAAVLRAH